jgi:integrase
MKLLPSNIARLAGPEPGLTQKIHWDDELKGFGMRVTAAGVRSYVVRGSVNGKEKRLTVERVDRLALAEARKRGARMLLDMGDGKDPKEEKRKKIVEGLTLREVMQDYVDHKTTKNGPLRASSIKSIKHHVENNFAAWADQPIVAITAPAILKQYRVLVKQGPVAAFQATSVLQAMMRWARKSNKAVLEDPLDILQGERQKPKARDERIPNEKVGAVYAMLRKRATEAKLARTKIGADIVSFLMLTGARWEEAAGLTWDRVDLEGDVPSWHLDAEHAKNHNELTLPLSSAALEILKTRYAARNESNPYVFPARHTGTFEGVKDARPTMKLVSKIAGLHLTAHPMRRTFSNVANKVGVDYVKIELLTNHKPTTVTLIHYLETSDLRESCAAEIEKVGKWIEHQATIASSSNVVALRA